jgi:polyhydroxybutyrate depolymerase
MSLPLGFRSPRRIWPAFVTGICFSTFIAPSASRAQETREKIDVDNVTRNFVVHLPTGYNQQQHYPVVIVLHPQNQDADDMARLTHFSQFADKNGIIAVYPIALRGEWNIQVKSEEQPAYQPRPYGRRGGWGGGGYPGGGGGYPGGGRSGGENPNGSRTHEEPPDDITFLNQMLDQLPLKYSIDVHRIYATGLGDGGFMAERVGCNLGDRVAAVAPVGAAFPKKMICLPAHPVSALFISGTDDPIVPDGGGTYKPGHFHVLSAEDSAKSWASFDHCAEKPAQSKLPPAEKGGKDTKVYTYGGCQENAQVALYSVKNGGNTWPGGEQYTSEKEIGKTSNAIKANETIWNFFSGKKTPDTAAQK